MSNKNEAKNMAAPTKVVVYSSTTIPPHYKCKNCGATNCKIWRLSHDMNPPLLCVDCAAKDQSKDISTMNKQGKRKCKEGISTDTIGWYLPAVPMEDGIGYWQYGKVPDAGCDWWKRLPLRGTSSRSK